GTGFRDEFGAGVLRGEPGAALVEDFGLGVNPLDFVGGAVGDESVVDFELDLRVDVDVAVEVLEGVEGFGDPAADGVFDGDEAVVDVSAGDLSEDSGDGVEVLEVNRSAEMADSCHVRVRADGAEVADVQRLLEAEGAAHELAVDALDGSIGEWPSVEGE